MFISSQDLIVFFASLSVGLVALNLYKLLSLQRAEISDPWGDVSHQVAVYPVDDACIDVTHLEESWNLDVPGGTIDPNHRIHAPSTIRVSDDHGHACFDVQKDGI